MKKKMKSLAFWSNVSNTVSGIVTAFTGTPIPLDVGTSVFNNAVQSMQHMAEQHEKAVEYANRPTLRVTANGLQEKIKNNGNDAFLSKLDGYIFSHQFKEILRNNPDKKVMLDLVG